MSWIKWAWAAFAAASLVVLVRTAWIFLPAPAEQHAENVEAAAGGAAAILPAEEGAPAEIQLEAEEPTTWAEEAEPVAAEVPVFESASPAAVPEVEGTDSPEEFHFRRIRWGMTLAEVRDSEAIEPLKERPGGLLYATTTLGMPCLLGYSFAQDRLVRASLSFSDPSGRDIPPLSVAQAQRRFLFLREQLCTRYGDPVQKTTRLPRDVSGLRRTVQKQEELSKQYDAEIGEAEERLNKQRGLLQRRYEGWANREVLVARGLASYERDLRELRQWKKEAVDQAAQSRKTIQERKNADAMAPLLATLTARWPFAREIQHVELRLDLRHSVPRLEVRYEAAAPSVPAWGMDEL